MKTETHNSRRVAKNTLMLYCRTLLVMVVSLFTSRVVLDTLGVEDFGLYSIVAGVVLLLGFLNNSMTVATQRFLNVELGRLDVNRVKIVFNTSRVIHWLVALFVVLLGETLGVWLLNTHMNINADRVVAANWVFQFALVSFIVTITSVPYNACIIAHEKMSVFAYISLLETILKLVIVFFLYILPGDRLIVYGTLMTLPSIFIRIIYGRYCKLHFEECRDSQLRYDKNCMRAMLGFSGWTIFGALGSLSHTQGIGVIINMFFGVSVNAAQSVSNQVIRIVNEFLDSFMTALKPQIVKTYSQGDFDALHSLVIRGSKIGICLVSLMVVPLLFEIPSLLDIWLKEVPEYTVDFIRLILITTLCSSFAYPLSTARAATGNIRNYQIVLTTMGWLHLPIAWFFYYLGYPPQTAMLIYLAIVVIQQVYRILNVCPAIELSVRHFAEDVLLRSGAAVSIAFGLSYLLSIQLPQDEVWKLLSLFFSFGITAIIIWSIAITKSEKKQVLTIIRSKLCTEKKR